MYGALLMNRKIKIDMDIFLIAFGRDVDFHDTCPRSVFLDLDTGDVLWVYEEDDDASFEEGISEEENKRNREQINDNPERHLEIPGFSHGGHHQILQDFLESEWTDNIELWQKAKNAYFGSIGGWIKKVNEPSIEYKYYDYKNLIIQKEAMKFLDDHDITLINKT